MSISVSTCHVCGLTLAVFAAVPAVSQAELLGIDFRAGIGSTLYTLNTTTGTASTPRSTTIVNAQGLTTRSTDGAIFVLGGVSGNQLWRVNPTTGSPTFVGTTGSSEFIEGDLSYDAASGFIYATQDFVAGTYRFARIDPANGNTVVLGTTTGVFDLSALAFGPTGTLYALDTGVSGVSRLLTLDKSNGQILTNTPMNVDLGSAAGLAFDPATGTAYVTDGTSTITGSYNLYTLSTTTGTLTTVGPTGIAGGLSGLTFTAIPEPASLAIAATGLILTSRRRRT